MSRFDKFIVSFLEVFSIVGLFYHIIAVEIHQQEPKKGLLWVVLIAYVLTIIIKVTNYNKKK